MSWDKDTVIREGRFWLFSNDSRLPVISGGTNMFTTQQKTFRGRNDNGSETTATFIAANNTNWTQSADVNFRIRFVLQETGALSGTFVPQLQYNLNNVGYNNVTGSSLVVRASASANFTDGVASTSQLGTGTGTFAAGSLDEVDGVVANVTVAASGYTEVEYCIQIRSVDVVNADNIQLRIVGKSTAGVALDTYTVTPSITASVPFDQTVAASGIKSTEVVGIATASIPTPGVWGSTLTTWGDSTRTWTGAAAGGATQTISPAGVTSSERLGTSQLSQYIVPAAISTSEAVGNAATAQAISAYGIQSSQAVGNVVATPGAVTVIAAGILTQGQAGTAVVAVPVAQTITATSIYSAQAIGTANAGQALAASGIPSNGIFGNVVAAPGTATITSAGIRSSELFGTAAATTAAAQTISAGSIPSAQALGSAVVAEVIQSTVEIGSIRWTVAAGILAATSTTSTSGSGLLYSLLGAISTTVTDAEASMQTDRTISPSGIKSKESVSTASATQVISATGIPSSQASGNLSAVLLVSPVGIESKEIFGTTIVTTTSAPQTIAATGISSAQVAGAVLVGQAIAPAGILSAEALGATTATPGAVTISPTGIASGQVLGAVIAAIAVPQSLSVAGITSGQYFGLAQLAQALSIAGISSTERAGNAVITPGAVTLSVAGISSQQIFGTTFVSLGLTITIASIQTTQRFGDSAIIPEGVPEAILASTNLAGFVTAIRDNPSSPDAEFLTAVDPASSTDLRVSFITPFKQPNAVGGPRTFRVYVRRTTNSGTDPNAIIELWESGVFRRELATTSVSSTAGQLIEAAMDPADLTDATGAGVELRLRGVP